MNFSVLLALKKENKKFTWQPKELCRTIKCCWEEGMKKKKILNRQNAKYTQEPVKTQKRVTCWQSLRNISSNKKVQQHFKITLNGNQPWNMPLIVIKLWRFTTMSVMVHITATAQDRSVNWNAHMCALQHNSDC